MLHGYGSIGSFCGFKAHEFVAHKGNANCVTIGPRSGQVLASGGDDKRVNVWRIGRASSIWSLTGNSSSVESLRFDHSEEYLVSGSAGGAVKLYDMNAGKMTRNFRGHMSNVTVIDCGSFNPRLVATGSMDCQVKMWNANIKECAMGFRGHAAEVTDVQFSPDGYILASASADGEVKLWDLRAERPMRTFQACSGRVRALHFNPQELLLAAATSDRTVKLYDVELLEFFCATAPDTSPARALIFDNEGERLYCVSPFGLKRWRWDNDRALAELEAMGDVAWGKVAAGALHFNHEGRQLLGGACTGDRISVWAVDVDAASSGRQHHAGEEEEHDQEREKDAASGHHRGYHEERFPERVLSHSGGGGSELPGSSLEERGARRGSSISFLVSGSPIPCTTEPEVSANPAAETPVASCSTSVRHSDQDQAIGEGRNSRKEGIPAASRRQGQVSSASPGSDSCFSMVSSPVRRGQVGDGKEQGADSPTTPRDAESKGGPAAPRRREVKGKQVQQQRGSQDGCGRDDGVRERDAKGREQGRKEAEQKEEDDDGDDEGDDDDNDHYDATTADGSNNLKVQGVPAEDKGNKSPVIGVHAADATAAVASASFDGRCTPELPEALGAIPNVTVAPSSTANRPAVGASNSSFAQLSEAPADTGFRRSSRSAAIASTVAKVASAKAVTDMTVASYSGCSRHRRGTGLMAPDVPAAVGSRRRDIIRRNDLFEGSNTRRDEGDVVVGLDRRGGGERPGRPSRDDEKPHASLLTPLLEAKELAPGRDDIDPAGKIDAPRRVDTDDQLARSSRQHHGHRYRHRTPDHDDRSVDETNIEPEQGRFSEVGYSIDCNDRKKEAAHTVDSVGDGNGRSSVRNRNHGDAPKDLPTRTSRPGTSEKREVDGHGDMGRISSPTPAVAPPGTSPCSSQPWSDPISSNGTLAHRHSDTSQDSPPRLGSVGSASPVYRSPPRTPELPCGEQKGGAIDGMESARQDKLVKSKEDCTSRPDSTVTTGGQVKRGDLDGYGLDRGIGELGMTRPRTATRRWDRPEPPTDNEIISRALLSSSSIISTLTNRLAQLRLLRSGWAGGDVSGTIARLKRLDKSVTVADASPRAIVVDFLAVVPFEAGAAGPTLEHCLELMPLLEDLWKIDAENSVAASTRCLECIVRRFGGYVRDTLRAPISSLGVDLARDERVSRCREAHRAFVRGYHHLGKAEREFYKDVRIAGVAERLRVLFERYFTP